MNSIRPSGFYIFRKPNIPVEVIFDFFEQTKSSPFKDQIRTIFSDKHLQKALYVTSPALFGYFENWIKTNDDANEEKIKKTLFKYLIRTCCRPTPFGLFAGCTSPGHFAENTAISINEDTPAFEHNRLTMHSLFQITQFISNHAYIKPQILFYPNNSLYKVADKYRYTFYEIEDQARSYSICSVESSFYLEKVLNEAKKGLNISQMASSLITENITYEIAESFILQLITEQVLVSEFEIRLTGPEFLHVLIHKLSLLHGTSEITNKLIHIQELLIFQGNGIAQFSEIRNILEKNYIPPSDKSIIHTDLIFKTIENQISHNAIDNLTNTFKELLVLNQISYNSDLENFKKMFYDRFEEQEVPLLFALDSEVGIGYGERLNNDIGNLPLLEDINLPKSRKDSKVEWNAWKTFILKKYSEALLQNSNEIILSEQDLKSFQAEEDTTANIPSSFAAFGNLIAESDQAIDRGDFLFNLYLIAGPSGGNLMGRFCSGNEELKEYLTTYLESEAENYPDAILAEIVHLPEETAGNILVRPSFRKYEIPFLSESSVEKEYQIPLDDLRISVRHGREIILRSSKLNKRIIPRLTTTHNFNRGLGPYKFLCDLQFENQAVHVKWHWSILEKQQFLPRVSYKNVILSRASWRFSLEDFPGLKSNKSNADHLLKSLCIQFRIPRFVLLCDNDNELLIDFENMHCMDLLKEELIKKEIVILKEYLQIPAACFLKDKRGRYTNEIIIPFQKSHNKIISKIHPSSESQVKRKFTMGSEWLYVKIYAGEKTADNLLKGVINELADELLEDRLIDKWFFCRYTDPNNHLRVRFHGDPQTGFYKDSMQKIHLILDQYLQQNLINKIQTDTYQREIERYGGNSITLSEDIFFNDSKAVINFLVLLDNDSKEEYRWLFALKGVDVLLDDFDYSVEEKQSLMNELYKNYASEFKEENLSRLSDDKYRKHSRQIEEFLSDHLSGEAMKYEVTSILNERSVLNRKISRKISEETILSDRSLDELLSSYIHMFLNRLFISKPRLHEYIIYHHLNKYFKGVISRKRNKSTFKSYSRVFGYEE